MPRKLHKYHFIYKTTCLINEKFYYGMHSTSNLEDGYIGSGTKLWHSINKHGRENFKCEVLEYLPDRKTLAARENELITEEMLQHPMCMNLKQGGNGGCTKEVQLIRSSAGGISYRNKLKADESFRNLISDKFSKMQAEGKLKSWPIKCDWNGKHHSEKTKQQIKNTRAENKSGVGERNSQFGTCWITNGIENKKIKKCDLNLHLILNWNLGRKIKTIAL